jgi:hypothetical protein
MAEVLAEVSDFLSRLIVDDNAIAGGAGVAAGAAVAVGDEVMRGGILARGSFTLRKQRLAAGTSGIRHEDEFTTGQ